MFSQDKTKSSTELVGSVQLSVTIQKAILTWGK